MEKKELLALCRRLQQGDNAAFALLYESCYSPIYRFIFGLSFSREIAEDITQETFLKAAKSIGSFKTGNFLSWLFTIARNAYYDFARKQNRQAVLDSEHENIATETSSIDETILFDEKWQSIEQMITNLSVEDRELLLLRYWGDRGMDEIALIKNKSHAAIRKQMSRIITKLKMTLDE